MRLLPISAYLTILPLLVLSTVQGAVVRHCTGFEGQLGEFIPSLKVQTEYPSTVLISYLNDLDQHLMVDLDLDVTMSVADYWYPLYNDNNTFDESVVLVKKPMFGVVNTELQAGESIMYNATLAGVYCAVINQHNTSEVDLEGLQITTTHMYGDYKLTGYHWLKIIILIIPVAMLHYVLIPWVFPNIHEYHLNESVWCLLKYAIIGKLYVTAGKVLCFGVLDTNTCTITWDNLRTLYFLNFWTLLNHVLSLVVITSLYKVAIGVLSFKKGEVEQDPQNFYGSFAYFWKIMIPFLINIALLSIVPVTLPQVSTLPCITLFYSALCDWQGALFAMSITQIHVDEMIEREVMKKIPMFMPDTTKRTPKHTEKMVWTGSSLIAYVIVGCSGVLLFMNDVTVGFSKYDMYVPNDPSTGYNYVIMWNVVCNGVFALPGILMEKLLELM